MVSGSLPYSMPGDGTHIYLVYGDVPLGWVAFLARIPKHGCGFVLLNP